MNKPFFQLLLFILATYSVFVFALEPPLPKDDGLKASAFRCVEGLSHDRKDFQKFVLKFMEKWTRDIRSRLVYETTLRDCLDHPMKDFDTAVRHAYCNAMENVTEDWRRFCRESLF